jgi:hypothetical protein
MACSASVARTSSAAARVRFERATGRRNGAAAGAETLTVAVRHAMGVAWRRRARDAGADRLASAGRLTQELAMALPTQMTVFS